MISCNIFVSECSTKLMVPMERWSLKDLIQVWKKTFSSYCNSHMRMPINLIVYSSRPVFNLFICVCTCTQAAYLALGSHFSFSPSPVIRLNRSAVKSWLIVLNLVSQYSTYIVNHFRLFYACRLLLVKLLVKLPKLSGAYPSLTRHLPCSNQVGWLLITIFILLINIILQIA